MTGKPAPADTTTLWYTRCPLPSAFSLALHSGLIEGCVGNQAATRSLRHSTSAEVRLSHFNHSVPGQIRHGGNVPPIWARANGVDIRLVGLSWTNEGQLLLVDEHSDIASVADLRGRRLALPRRPRYPIDFWRASALRGYQNALASVGLTLGDVRLVDIEIDDDPFPADDRSTGALTPPGTPYRTLRAQRSEGLALLRGEVDAIFSPAHYGLILSQVIGARVLSNLAYLKARHSRLNNSTLLAFTVDGMLLDKHPELVQSLLEAIQLGASRGHEDPRQSARVIAAESGNAEELAPDIFGEDFLADLSFQLDEAALNGLEQQMEFLFHQGFIPRIPHLEEWMDPRPLAAANRELRHRGVA